MTTTTTAATAIKIHVVDGGTVPGAVDGDALAVGDTDGDAVVVGAGAAAATFTDVSAYELPYESEPLNTAAMV